MQRSILPVLDTFTPANEAKVTISYRGIARYASVGSHSTVAAALRRFQTLHILRKRNSRAAQDGFRSCGTYEWTMDDPEFLEIASARNRKQREEIEAERSLRAEAKTRRKAALITGKYSVHPL